MHKKIHRCAKVMAKASSHDSHALNPMCIILIMTLFALSSFHKLIIVNHVGIYYICLYFAGRGGRKAGNARHHAAQEK